MDINFIKSLLKFEFTRYNIPEGYHSISLKGNDEIIIISKSKEYNYLNVFNAKCLINFFYCKITISKDDKLIIKCNTSEIDQYKIRLWKEYSKLYFDIFSNKHINHINIYDQLKCHLVNNDTIINQELFTNICIKNELYYSDLYSHHFRENLDYNEDSNEIIKLFVKDIEIEYIHLFNLIKYLKYEDIEYIMKFIKLDDVNENYLLLLELIQMDSKLVKLFMDNFINFKDYEVIVNKLITTEKWNDNKRLIFDILVNYDKINLIDESIPINCIKTGNLYILDYLITSEKFTIKDSHKDLMIKYEKFEMYKKFKDY